MDKKGLSNGRELVKCTLCKGHFEKEPRQLVEAAVCILQAAAVLNSIGLDDDNLYTEVKLVFYKK